MRIQLFVLIVLMALLSVAAVPLAASPTQISASAEWSQPTASHPLASNPGALLFVENVGQFDPAAHFHVRGQSGGLWLTADALWLTMQRNDEGGMMNDRLPSPVARPSSSVGVNLKLTFVGANPNPRLEPFGRSTTKVSFFTGQNAAQWRPDVPVWSGVRYADLYPGLDLVLASNNGQLQPRLVCKADCSSALEAVRLRVEGAESLTLLDRDAEQSAALSNALDVPLQRSGAEAVLIHTAAGDLTWPLLLVVNQDGAPTRTLTDTPATIGNEIIAPFSASTPMAGPAVMPAYLSYSTFLGGSDWDNGLSIAPDSTGNTYVTGFTYSSDFPTTVGAYDTISNGYWDIFVAKLNPTGSSLLYSTYLGSSNLDTGYSIAVDSTGAAYMAGRAYGSDYPTTVGAYDPTWNGGSDAVVTKLDPTGSALVYSTYLGGSDTDLALSMAVDGTGAVYVTGLVYSADYPTTGGAYDTTANGWGDPFVTKLNAAGSALDYSTYLGGGACVDDLCADMGQDIAVDAAGNAYVVGLTPSSDFPTTLGAYDTSHAGGSCSFGFATYDCRDAFVLQLNATGSALVYSTFLGASRDDLGMSLAIDSSGNAYATGSTASFDFPTTVGAYDTSFGGGYFEGDVFVTKLNPAGNALVYSTYVGDTLDDRAFGLAIDAGGKVYLTGDTLSTNFPTTAGAYDTTHNGGNWDAFLLKLNAAGSALNYSTFLGGMGADEGDGLATSTTGNVYVTGYTDSTDYPTTVTAYDTTYNGGGDAFVTRFFLNNVLVVHNIMMRWEIFRPDELAVRVRILDLEDRAAVPGATVTATFTLPDGVTRQSAVSGAQGWANFHVPTAGGGACTIDVVSVTLDSYTLDIDNSTLNKTIECP